MSEDALLSLGRLRQTFNDHRILMCFNGLISSNLIGEMGLALKRHIESVQPHASTAVDVFSVYIEFCQNISHYARTHELSDVQSSATVVISETDAGSISITAGNWVHPEDGRDVIRRISELHDLDAAALKQRYKKQLRRPRVDGATSGAGLGLLQVARTVRQPVQAYMDEQLVPDGLAFLAVRAVI
ncbi:hypothetical protein EVJ50_05930 [Synechococcus sp. RSCCF101]|uniref:SiaB family protein kinase n=1 Tax=Synechococcus sp. RSCCF101 TaxID=2511069 RepID=UPI001247A1E9|nr:SiaB family protein kinase [Synechococcus sp. RSCCF101]QEY31850.1 hypothetical protein EVJ50_05930 [Synechococcus sp. RSCCF101]